jgi:NAD(P)-dependent dehydrogenase (short-subunit alcohol dehydrogenase family)
MKKKIVVIDGMGGGLGAELVARLTAFKHTCDIIALGTNASATERMIKAGAQRGATGENAIRVSAALGDFILGPIGIVIADSMLGEITAAMASAVFHAPGEKVLLPMQNEHFYIAGWTPPPLGKQIDDALAYLTERITNSTIDTF